MTITRSVVSLMLAAGVVAGAVAARAQQGPPRDKPVAPLVGTATIAGTVSSADADSKPIYRAQLMILGIDNGYIKISESDQRGRFTFGLLPAGRYYLGVSKTPYLDATYGAKRAGRPGTAINVAEGERVTDIALKMTRGAVVSGMVSDERGQPLPNANVRLLPVQLKDGQRTIGPNAASSLSAMMLGNGANTRTDERGLYRTYGVAPGEYAVMVSVPSTNGPDIHVLTDQEIQAGLQALNAGRAGAPPPISGPPPGGPAARGSSVSVAPPAPPQGQAVSFAPVYYPGATDSAEAGSITVGVGEERNGVDIRTRLVATARLEGAIVGIDPPFNVQLTLRPSGQSVDPVLLFSGGMSSSARVTPDGKFVLPGVSPGRYTLTARTVTAQSGGRGGVPPAGAGGGSGGSNLTGSAPAAPVQQMWASQEVTVMGQNQTGLLLQMQPGMTLSGKVVFHPTVGAKEPKDASVGISVRTPQPLGLLGSLNGLGNGTMTKDDRTFIVEGLIPDRYVITAMLAGNGPAMFGDLFGWAVESITAGGRDITDVALDLKPGGDVKDVVITLGDRKQEVLGTLKQSSGTAATDYTVILFPADQKFWLTGSRRVVTARPATDGRFELVSAQGIPPGSYCLAAVTDLGPDEQFEPKLLSELAKSAVKFTLAAGEKKQQDLRIK